jgi:U6 snRNA m6A methyltransferase
MHPRNRFVRSHSLFPAEISSDTTGRYKCQPDFKEVSESHPALKQFLIGTARGKCTLNFRDHAALRELCAALLAVDFDLKIQIPEGKLVPTVPLRLNYIHWLEDLVGPSTSCRGIDIGALAWSEIHGAERFEV